MRSFYALFPGTLLVLPGVDHSNGWSVLHSRVRPVFVVIRKHGFSAGGLTLDIF
nr:MAG TPA: hypothetical protein [Caudoviricetes sp.]DAW94033.1 MAG TPA: hypothetical protein [Caudoviricetes sp.]